jgi:hypothetical protein
VAGRDITEGRSTRAIAVDVGVGTGNIWQNTGNSYDVAIAGIPFFLGVNDQRPYERATAPFRKQQFDSQRDPGEQSLTGWWLRSQSSFHAGEGITFYDPLANPYSTTLASNSYRIKDAFGVNIWEPGQVTLLRSVTQGHNTTATLKANKRSSQTMRTVQYLDGATAVDAILLHDGYDIDRIHADGTVDHWVDYASGSYDPVYSVCDDGQYAYWVTNDVASGKFELDKKLISASTSTAPTTMFTKSGITVSNAVIEYVKQRLVIAVNNVIYETPTNASTSTSMTTVYTHPNTSVVFSSITESGTAIYVSAYNGMTSSILKFNLDNTGAMPVLTSAITAAVMPHGEVIHKIYCYLAYMMIGTNKGVRVASIDGNGSLTYGPLIKETVHPCYDFAARDHYVWCATGLPTVNTEPGVIRIDLSNEIDNLRFAYAKDLNYDTTSHAETTACAFIGETDQLAFCTTADSSGVGYVYMEHATQLRTDGYIQTGYIRYNTLEQKNFKRVVGHGDFSAGSMSLQSVDFFNTVYDINSYDLSIGNPESAITQPAGAQDAIALRFHLYRDSTTDTSGPTFKGYQLKAVPASPRERIIKIPLLNYDTETDKYNQTIGYEGRAYARLASLEDAEASGDVVTWQDFRTGEIQQCLIEEVLFTDITPPDKKLTGFGGIISLTIRTV